MSEEIASRLRDLARRAGLEGIPPSVVGGFAVVLCVALLLGVWKWWPRSQSGADTAAHAGESSKVTSIGAGGGAGESTSRRSEQDHEASDTTLYVHVVGAVKHPGLYQLTPGARVADALRDAGGFGQGAAQEAVNLARVLTDGEQVVVPTRKELERSGVKGVLGAAGLSAKGGSGNEGTPGSGSTGPVNINTADAALLDTLPGVGPSTAAKIVADREANGRFGSVEDLGRVSGIGPKKLEQLKGVICVD